MCTKAVILKVWLAASLPSGGLNKNVDSQAPAKTYRIRNPGEEPVVCVLANPSGDTDPY